MHVGLLYALEVVLHGIVMDKKIYRSVNLPRVMLS